MHFSIFILIASLAATLSTPISSQTQDDLAQRYGEVDKAIQSLATLEYGQSCHYDLEQKGEAILLRFVNSDPDEATTVLDEMENFLLKDVGTYKRFCSGKNFLKCSGSGRCDCPKFPQRGGQKFNYVHDDGVCHLLEGSSCLPEDFAIGNCYDGTECQGGSNEKCTSQMIADGENCSCAQPSEYSEY